MGLQFHLTLSGSLVTSEPIHTRTMKHLSALDALFLQLETPDTPMHVGSLMLLDRPPARLWARRSVFMLRRSRLLVTEVFLPAILALAP